MPELRPSKELDLAVGNGTALLAVLAAMLLAVFVAGCGGSKDGVSTQGAVPRAASIAELQAAQRRAGHPVWWLGEESGHRYELTEAAGGRTYIRYLPANTEIGTKERLLTVGSFPYENAYQAVAGMATKPGAKVVKIPNGIAVSLPSAPESTYVAFDGSDVEIEIFDPGTRRPDRATLDQLAQVR